VTPALFATGSLVRTGAANGSCCPTAPRTSSSFAPEASEYASPSNTPFHQHAIPPSWIGQPYTRWRPLRELPDSVLEGDIAPWFEQPGGGMQYKFDRPIEGYLDNEYLGVVDP
jgi:hypothetical protein